jgi:hypothetical protein
LPNKDDVFKDIVQRAITLHSDAYSLNDKRRSGALPTDGDAKARLETEALKRLWNCFLPTLSASNQAAASDGVVSQFLNQPILLPSARFLKQFMFLIFAWIRALPVNNKVRFNRFAKETVRELSIVIVEKAKEAENNAAESNNEGNNPASFSTAFAAANKTEVGWQGTYLREAAAYMYLMVAISMKYQLEALRGENITSYPRLAGAAKKVRKWTCPNDVKKWMPASYSV